MKAPDFDVDKFLDSLTIEELRFFAKVGIGVTSDVLSFVVPTLMNSITNSKKNSMET